MKILRRQFLNTALAGLMALVGPVVVSASPWHVGDSVSGFPGFKNGEWPKLRYGHVGSSVAFSSVCFHYFYSVGNPADNSFPIYIWGVDLRLEPWRHPFNDSDVTMQHTERQHGEMIDSAPIVRLLAKDHPQGWEPNISTGESEDPSTWGTLPPDDRSVGYVIEPGSTVTGFGWSAKEPPGIREFVLVAWSSDFFLVEYRDVLREHGYDPDSPDFWTQFDRGIAYYGRTLAPVTPPASFTTNTWTIRMLSDVTAARHQAWIETDAQLVKLKELIRKLDVTSLAALRKAVADVEDFVGPEVAAGRMTSEADALIRLNAEYLLRRAERDSGILKAKR